MSKVLVVYWSGTGNTEAMAQEVAEGVKEAGVEAVLTPVSACSAAGALEYDRIAFGCAAMGDEVLDEDEMEPFFTECEGGLSGKKVALFGSYDWGDGQWMRDWADRVKAAGATLCGDEGLIAHLDPDDDAKTQCRALGAAMAKM